MLKNHLLTAKVLAPIVLLLIVVLFFLPLFQGKTIFQGDIVNYQGASQEIKEFRDNNHQEPLWTNSMFSGMPAYQISVQYPNNYMQHVLSFLKLGLPHVAANIFLSMLGFYLLGLVLGWGPWISLIGAIAFGFSSYFIIIIEAGHNTKSLAIALFPFILASVYYAYRKNALLGALFFSVSMALEMLANHPQMTYYLGIVMLFVILAEAMIFIKNQQLTSFVKTSSLLLVGLLLAISTNISNLLLTYEYSKHTIRGKSELTLKDNTNQTSGLDKDYATAWSYGIGESFTLLIPNYKGGGSGSIGEHPSALKEVPAQDKQGVSSMDSYFGDQPFTSGPVYVGAIICFLFVLSFFILRGPFYWALIAAFVLSLMLSWGKNFMGLTDFFLDYVPGYNKFRAVASILVNVELIMPLVACMTLAKLLDALEEREKFIKPLMYSLAIVGGFSLLQWLAPDLLNTFEKVDEIEKTVQQYVQYGAGKEEEVRPYIAQLLPSVIDARKAIASSDAIRSFFFVLIAGLALLGYIKKVTTAQVSLGIIGVLTLFDLWSVNKRYLTNENYVAKRKMEVAIEKTPVDEKILADKDLYYRVYNTTVRPDQDSKTSYFHKSLGGYHGAKLRRYQELIDYHFNRGNRAAFNMLNTKYFIFKDAQGNLQAQQNPEALGNAWFVDRYNLVQNPDSEINALYRFNPRKEAVVDQVFSTMLKSFVPDSVVDSAAYIRLTAYAPNKLSYAYQSSKPQLTVFSDVYYKEGWNAYIDGEKSDYFRANYILRAMLLPQGKHVIEFKFEPETYYLGEKISLASSSAILLLLISVLAREVYLAYFAKKQA